MRVTRSILAILFALSPTAFAEIKGDPQVLKKSFANSRDYYAAKFKQASELNYQFIRPSHEISMEQCLALQKKIETNYNLSPFFAEYENGTAQFDFCESGGFGGHYAPEKLFYQDVSVKNQFGIQGAYALQSLSSHGKNLSTLLLDHSFKIIELTERRSRSVDRNFERPLHYSVSSIDHEGHVFSNHYHHNAAKHPWYRRSFTSVHGEIPTSQEIYGRLRNGENEGVLITLLHRTVDENWDDFTLLITHAWSNGFYQYNGELYTESKSYDRVAIYEVNGKEVCVDGASRREKQFTFYPASPDQARGGHCFNSW